MTDTRIRTGNSRGNVHMFSLLHRDLALGRRGFLLAAVAALAIHAEIHLEECTRCASDDQPRSHDRSLHAFIGLNHKIVPERSRNSADLRAEP